MALTLSLSPQVFSILSALIEERCGIHYGPADLDLLSHKVGPRVVEAGFESMLDYYYFLRYDPHGAEELEQLIDVLVVNESYFFRELDQLEVLVGSVLAPLVRANGRARIWSAACAGGEEPLTLAMMLAERGLLDQVDIIASDVSPRVLARARRGIYSRRALRQPLETTAGGRYLEVTDAEVRVAPGLIDRIDWRRVNLVSDAEVASIPTVDVVLCRNVLIYFSDEVARAAVNRLAGRLTAEGLLFVGVSESLLRFGTSLTCEEKNGVFYYKRSGQ